MNRPYRVDGGVAPTFRARSTPMRKCPAFKPTNVMDIERINSIGTLLADLSARTEQLRGYL